jgi:cellulose synthase/poly-beta-1,6-N-acetylglucosamine synthase-like glycosyltransferase
MLVLLTAFFLATALIAVDHGAIAAGYQRIVLRLALWAYSAPAVIAPYAKHLLPTLRAVMATAIVLFGVIVSASPARRLVIALHALAYLSLAVLLDSLLLALAAWTRLPIGGYGVEGILTNLLLAGVVMLHLFFTSFQLPRHTLVPVQRRVYRWATVQLLGIGAATLLLYGLLVSFLASSRFGGRPTMLLLGFMTYSVLWNSLMFLLVILGLFSRRPPITVHRPPIDVIMCAWNENPGIAETIRSIEAAAVRYGGPVRVILADDGSVDGTPERAEAEMRQFKAARGEVVRCPHAGKSTALNLALSRVTAGIALRIDADVVIEPDSLLYLPGWFDDPTVGSVGAAMSPRMGRSWIHRMRLLECLSSFFFARVGLMTVDAISCIPGTFQAIRPDPARSVGGFVVGMNGEDADLTMQLGRLGYRAIVDTRIRAYEDAPRTVAELQEQRTRWYRAGAHVFARHGIFLAGSAGPRVWFNSVRLMGLRFLATLRPILFLYSGVLALLEPTFSRNIWFVFVLYGSSAVPVILVTTVLALRFGFARYLPWFLLWYPTFVVLRRAFVIQSFLTLPTRPVRFSLPLIRRVRVGVPSASPL